MNTNLFSTVAFVLISSFTPGPSNISSASMAVLHGYKNTLRYQLGLAVGVFALMFLTGLLSTTLLKIFPALEAILRYAGAGYILYLALGILRASYAFTERDVKPLRFVHGIMLQILNPKLIVYAFTLFSAFLAPINGDLFHLIMTGALLAAISFCATTAWALFGTAIRNYLHIPRLKAAVNISLSLLLVYAALTLVIVNE
jgi:cysteine/O-acetylserine efflux protein